MKERLRRLPAVDTLAADETVQAAAAHLPRPLVMQAVRTALDDVRRLVRAGEADVDTSSPALARRAAAAVHALRRRLLIRVVNGTGVLLHTNLGRAPLSDAAVAAVADVAGHYSNLEYDVDAGGRGSRHVFGEAMLTELTGAEAAMVVNNNAAAVLLVLSALAAGREVVVSRGELIEIGGAFRIPDVMEQSGCVLREVGTTNRTRLSDYEKALGEHTGALLKVHPSNYRVVGFTETVAARQLVPLARTHRVPIIEDLGSGVLVPTEKYGLAHEPTVQGSIAAGVDVVTFSGDKLLGGPQAGIIVGRKELVDACKAHPLARAFRVGKLTLAALEATLAAYLDGRAETIPFYRMLAATPAELTARARAVVASATASPTPSDTSPTPSDASATTYDLRVVATESTIGGGSLPGETVASAGLSLYVPGRRADALAARLRRRLPPIVGRIENDRFVLDMRTIDPRDDDYVAAALRAILEDRSCTS